jgi:uncharacterized protein YukE
VRCDDGGHQTDSVGDGCNGSAIAAFGHHVERQEKAAAALVVAAKRLADRSTAAAKDVEALHAAFQGWESASQVEDDADGDFRALLGTSVRAVGAWSQVAQFQPAVHELLLLESARYLHHQAVDLKEMLSEREQLLQAADAPAPVASPAKAAAPATSQGFNFGGVSFPSTSASGFGLGSSFSSTASQFASRLRGGSEMPVVDVETHRRRARHVGELLTRALVAEEMLRFRWVCADAMTCWRRWVMTVNVRAQVGEDADAAGTHGSPCVRRGADGQAGASPTSTEWCQYAPAPC